MDEIGRLYTHEEAAPLLRDRYGKPLSGRAAVWRRIRILAERGAPLTIEAGELRQVGARRMLTERGLERLRNFEFKKLGRPRGAPLMIQAPACETLTSSRR